MNSLYNYVHKVNINQESDDLDLGTDTCIYSTHARPGSIYLAILEITVREAVWYFTSNNKPVKQYSKRRFNYTYM